MRWIRELMDDHPATIRYIAVVVTILLVLRILEFAHVF